MNKVVSGVLALGLFSSSVFAEVRGYEFSGDINAVHDSGLFDNFLGGSFEGEIIFDDDALPYYEESDLSAYDGVEFNISFTDAEGVVYLVSMSNGTFAIADNYLGNVDVFAVSNYSGLGDPIEVYSDLPISDTFEEVLYRVNFSELLNDVVQGTSLKQVFQYEDFTFKNLTVTGFAEVAGDTIGVSFLGGPVTSFEAFNVPKSLTAQENIGGYGYEGSFIYDQDSNAYSLRSGGANIGHWEDWFHYVYEPMQGDVDISARVQYISKGWSSAGIMLRKDLSTSSVYASTQITLLDGGEFALRKEKGVSFDAVSAPSLVEGSWLRLVKTGNLVTSYISEDGESWVEIAQEEVELGDQFYVGLTGVAESSEPFVDIVFDEVKVTQ